MSPDAGQSDTPPRSALIRVGFGVVIVALFAAFVALGVWQLERRAWKLELIRQVDARVHAAPASAPGPDRWPTISREADQYRRITVHGVFDNDRETLTQAVTDRGAGFWVMTPLRADTGFTVLINRGFVPTDRRDSTTRLASQNSGPTTVTGLLRITEPKGGFLRGNDPAADRWRSRDVQAIATRHGLDNVAPYFIDADAGRNPGGLPIGGLTVIRFPNSHLVYALTWFALALMTAAGGARVLWPALWFRAKRP